MNTQETSLLAAFKNVSAFGAKYTADFPANSTGAQQFAIVTAAVGALGALCGTQTSGAEQTHGGVLAKALARTHLHDDLLAITTGEHALVLLGNTAIAGKFQLPRNHGDQALLNTARAFAADAPAFTPALISVGLPATFSTQLSADIAQFEIAISAKGAALGTQGAATGGIADNAHKAAVALHVLDTVVKNTYKTNPQRLAEWAIASHVERHTPVPRPAKPATPTK